MPNEFAIDLGGDSHVVFQQLDNADCRLSVIADNGDFVVVDIPSEKMVEFICWCLPPALHEILAKHGVQLAKVY